LSQTLGLVGPLNPLIYNLPSTSDALHDITSGNNGGYSAGPGWDPCTGLGRPVGTKLLDDLELKYSDFGDCGRCMVEQEGSDN